MINLTEIEDLERRWKEAKGFKDNEGMLQIEKELIRKYNEAGINPDERFHKMYMESSE